MYKTFNQQKKDEALSIAKRHQEMDMFVQGRWLQEDKVDGLFKGCYFGCMTQTSDNTLDNAVKTLEMPHWIVWVGEKIFEGLPEEESKFFPVQLINAIPVNMDTEKMWKSWNIALLTDQFKFVNKGSAQHKAIQGVIDLYKCDSIDESADSADSAESARLAWSAASAWSAAADSAESAAAESAALARLAWSAALAWLAAAASAAAAAAAAWSAAAAAAESAESAESEYYIWMRDTLIEILNSCKK
jgi:hypothetical protein